MAVDKTFLEVKKAISSAGNFTATVAYGMPAFRYKTKIVACYMECKEHIGFYPYSSKVTPLFKKELVKYIASKGAVQFPKGKKVPALLIKKMVRARMKEIDVQLAQKPVKKKKA